MASRLPVVDGLKFGQAIGGGSFGNVYEATWNNREVAAKVLHWRHFESDPQILQKFKQECELLLSLVDHANVVKTFDAKYSTRFPPVLIMELLDCDLQRFIKRSTSKRKVSLNDTINITLDIAEGLCFLQRQKPPIIHRDLASKNVLLDAKKNAKIADLGMAKVYVPSGFCGEPHRHPGNTTLFSSWNLPKSKLCLASRVRGGSWCLLVRCHFARSYCRPWTKSKALKITLYASR